MAKFWVGLSLLIEADDYEHADKLLEEFANHMAEAEDIYDVVTTSPEEYDGGEEDDE